MMDTSYLNVILNAATIICMIIALLVLVPLLFSVQRGLRNLSAALITGFIDQQQKENTRLQQEIHRVEVVVAAALGTNPQAQHQPTQHPHTGQDHA